MSNVHHQIFAYLENFAGLFVDRKLQLSLMAASSEKIKFYYKYWKELKLDFCDQGFPHFYKFSEYFKILSEHQFYDLLREDLHSM